MVRELGIKDFKKLRRLLQQNVTLKYNFAKGQVFCDNSILITLYKIGDVKVSRAARAARLFLFIQPIKSLIRCRFRRRFFNSLLTFIYFSHHH